MDAPGLHWLFWLRDYEAKCPEPWPMREVKNKYVHRNIKGELVAGPNDNGYHTEDVLAHIEWHKTMTVVYRRAMTMVFP